MTNKINEARDDAERLSDRNEASDWEAEMMEALEKEFPNDKAWRTARELLPKELERLNREWGTAIPIQAAPRYPPRPAPMHNLQTFSSAAIRPACGVEVLALHQRSWADCRAAR